MSICIKVKSLVTAECKTRTRYNLLMAYMPTNFRKEIQYLHTLRVLLALLNTLFTIHSKLPALNLYEKTFFLILKLQIRRIFIRINFYATASRIYM